MYDITLDRYYDRFDTEPSHSDYKAVLFRAGDALQSAEMNEMQSALKNDLSKIASRFVANGGIISGIEVDTQYADGVTTDIIVNVSGGIIFADGEYVSVPPASFTKAGETLLTSEFKIATKIIYEEITHDDDATLLDPALETRNHGQAGAGRLKITGEVILEDSYVDASNTLLFPLFTIAQGEIVVPMEVEEDGFEKYRSDVVDIVAKYDRNSNGNYLINGHEIEYIGTTNPFNGSIGTNVGPFWFNVADGSSNVDGYNYEVEKSRYLELNALVDFELKQNEPQTFSVDGWYPVRHTPVNRAFRVTGSKIANNLGMTHGSFAGASDEIPAQYQPVLSIININQGGTVFVQGTDYALVGDTITWLNGGQEPAPNSSYTATFNYQYTETESNFSSDGNYSMGTLSSDKKSIYIHGFGNGSQVQYDYDFVLKRIDTVYIDSNGNLGVIKGVAAEDTPKAPENDTEKTLKIAEILLSGDADPVVNLTTNRTFKMSDIQLILDAVKDNDYNLSRVALEVNMMKNQPGASLRGAFVDTFNDDDSRDQGQENTAMCVGDNLIMNINWATQDFLALDELHEEQEYFEMDSTPSALHILSQPFWTKSRKVNSYLFQAPPQAKIKITPSVYRWIDKVNYLHFNRFRQLETLKIDTHLVRYNWNGWNKSYFYINDYTNKYTLKPRTSTRISTKRTPSIIPTIGIRINSNYAAFNSNEVVNITMDGLSCGTLTANAQGTLSGAFSVPHNSLSGAKEVRVEGAVSGVEGTTVFQAIPLTRTVTSVTTTYFRRVIRRLWIRNVNLRPVRRDPVAQTFTLREDTVLDRLEVMFSTKSVTDVTCIITETTAGMPDKTKSVVSKTVKVADLAAINTKQEFVFDNKVLLTGMKEYAFIIINDDPTAEIHVAELGKKTLGANSRWLTDPAYQTGVLFSSANNSAWTPHQKEDIRFWLYDCAFDNNGEFVYETKSVSNATDFMLLSDATVYEGTSIKYKVELLDRTGSSVPTEYIVDAMDQIPLTDSYTGDIKITAIMTSNGHKSPMLDANIQLSIGTSERTSAYTSKGIEVDYQDIEAVAFIDCFEPDNTNITAKIQIIDADTQVVSWRTMTRATKVKELGNDWQELKFTFALQNGGNHVIHVDQDLTRIKLEMATGDDEHRPVISNLRFNTVEI